VMLEREGETHEIPEVGEVKQSLLSILEQQSLRTTELGGAFGYGLYREAQYVMAAFADEVFLNAKWPGRTKWQLIEEALFHTHASGEIFFQKLDSLLAGGTSGSPDLAMIYFHALALDFCGRYRNHDPHKRLERYRRQLYMRIFQAAPEDALRQTVFPQPYESTFDEDEERRLPNPHMWWLVIAWIVVAWVPGTAILWFQLVHGIRNLLQTVETYAHSSETGK
jgi:type IV/VI secretion system ImpK/VasF family protein